MLVQASITEAAIDEDANAVLVGHVEIAVTTPETT